MDFEGIDNLTDDEIISLYYDVLEQVDDRIAACGPCQGGYKYCCYGNYVGTCRSVSCK